MEDWIHDQLTDRLALVLDRWGAWINAPAAERRQTTAPAGLPRAVFLEGHSWLEQNQDIHQDCVSKVLVTYNILALCKIFASLDIIGAGGLKGKIFS